MELTKEHEDALWAVRSGGDVFSLLTAKLLRECEQDGFVTTGPVMGEYGDGSNREPYFGARTTIKGLVFLQAALDAEGVGRKAKKK